MPGNNDIDGATLPSDVEEFRRLRKIARLPGVVHNPATVLASSLEKAKRMRAVALVIFWDDEDRSVDTDWSVMNTSDLAMAALMLQHEAVNEATKE